MARAAREEWAQRVARWEESGLTARAFAEEAGLSAQTLSYWKWKLKRDEGARSEKPAASQRRTALARSTEPMFVEVTTPAARASGALEIVVRDEVAVRVPVGFDEDTLARVLRLVRTAP
jgi:transposase